MSAKDLEGKKKSFVIRVDKTLEQTLELLIKGKAFALTDVENSNLDKVLNDKDNRLRWYILRKRSEKCSRRDDSAHTQLLIIGEELKSQSDYEKSDAIKNALTESQRKLCSPSPFTILSTDKLYSRIKSSYLECTIKANCEQEANEIWRKKHLRLSNEEGKNYYHDDYSSVVFNLQKISSGKTSNSGSVEFSESDTLDNDMSHYSTYDFLLNPLRDGSLSCYDDDRLLEYAILSDYRFARYCITEFFTNHQWKRDPLNILTLRFEANLIPGEYTTSNAALSHPLRTVIHKPTATKYYLLSMQTDNDVEVKWFHQSRDGELIPDTDVSKNHTWTNPVDLIYWLAMQRGEIEME